MSKHGLWAVPTLFPYPVRPYTPPHSREPLISHHLLLTYRTLLQSPSTSAGQFQAIRSVPTISVHWELEMLSSYSGTTNCISYVFTRNQEKKRIQIHVGIQAAKTTRVMVASPYNSEPLWLKKPLRTSGFVLLKAASQMWSSRCYFLLLLSRSLLQMPSLCT